MRNLQRITQLRHWKNIGLYFQLRTKKNGLWSQTSLRTLPDYDVFVSGCLRRLAIRSNQNTDHQFPLYTNHRRLCHDIHRILLMARQVYMDILLQAQKKSSTSSLSNLKSKIQGCCKENTYQSKHAAYSTKNEWRGDCDKKKRKCL